MASSYNTRFIFTLMITSALKLQPLSSDQESYSGLLIHTGLIAYPVWFSYTWLLHWGHSLWNKSIVSQLLAEVSDGERKMMRGRRKTSAGPNLVPRGLRSLWSAPRITILLKKPRKKIKHLWMADKNVFVRCKLFANQKTVSTLIWLWQVICVHNIYMTWNR